MKLQRLVDIFYLKLWLLAKWQAYTHAYWLFTSQLIHNANFHTCLLAQRTIILLLKQSVKCAPEKNEFLNPPLPLPRPPRPGRTHLNHSSVSRKTLPVRAPSSFCTHLLEIHHDQSSRNLLVYLKTCLFQIQNKTKINLNLPPIFILTIGRKN